MGKNIILLTAILLINNIDSYAQKTTYYTSFHKYFECVDTLGLEIEGLIIGDIQTFFPLPNNQFLLNDGIGEKLVLINFNSNDYKIISVEKTMPGYDFEILSIQKDPVAGFWVLGFPNYFFHFDSEGRLLEQFVDLKNQSIEHFFVFNSMIYALNMRSPNDIFVSRIHLSNSREEKIFDIDFNREIRNSIYRVVSGGFLPAKNGNFIIANSVENKIFKYNKSGILLTTFDSNLNIFESPKTDFGSNKNDLFEFFQQKNPRIDMFQKLYYLNAEMLIASYFIDRRDYIEIFSDEGIVLTKDSILIPKQLIYAEDGYIYLINEPDTEQLHHQHLNHFIAKYKFRF